MNRTVFQQISSLALTQTLNHDLDGTGSGTVLARLECLGGIFEGIAMGCQSLDVDDAALD